MEIELKFKLENPIFIENKIKNLGAKFLGKTEEFDIYLDDGKRSLSKQKKVLRLRYCDKGLFLTFKKAPKEDALDYKKRHELEINISNFDQALKIFNELGYKQIIARRKQRKTYNYGGCFLLIDKLPKIGYYLEIEAGSEVKINTVIKKLNLNKAHSTTLSYNELCK